MTTSNITNFIRNHVESIVRITSIMLFVFFIAFSVFFNQVGAKWFTVWLFGILIIILAVFFSILSVCGVKQTQNAYKIFGALSVWVLMHLMVRYCDPILFFRAVELISLWMFEFLLVIGIAFLSSCFANPNVVFIRTIYAIAMVLALLIFISHFIRPISAMRIQFTNYMDESWEADIFRQIKENNKRHRIEESLKDIRSLANKKGKLTSQEIEKVEEKEKEFHSRMKSKPKTERYKRDGVKKINPGTVLTEVIKEIPANTKIDTDVVITQNQIEQGVSCLIIQRGKIQTYWFVNGSGSDIEIRTRKHIINLNAWGKLELKGGEKPITVKIQIIYTGKKT